MNEDILRQWLGIRHGRIARIWLTGPDSSSSWCVELDADFRSYVVRERYNEGLDATIRRAIEQFDAESQ